MPLGACSKTSYFRANLKRLRYGAIFDVTDVDWSERLKALRSVDDPVATAHERLLNLIAALEVETIAPA